MVDFTQATSGLSSHYAAARCQSATVLQIGRYRPESWGITTLRMSTTILAAVAGLSSAAMQRMAEVMAENKAQLWINHRRAT